MKVELIKYTKDPERIIAAAAKSCYSKLTSEELYNTMSDEQVTKMVTHLLTAAHSSPIEHATFTYSISGVSRALTHQLVRHRLANYSHESMRYVNFSDVKFTLPPSILVNANNQAGKPTAKDVYINACKMLNSVYTYLVEECKVPKEDARYLLPNASQSNITVTMNAAELMHFFNLRCCTRAQWEIRNMANLMLEEAKKVAPVLFSKAGATCDARGYCSEGSQSCGRKPTLEKILNVYNKEMEK